MKKLLVFGFALAGMAAAAQVEAQVISRNPVNARADANVSGSWRVVGRDGSGNSVYERSTRDRNGNIVVQRARRNSNGTMTIISTRNVGNDNRGNSRNCDYNRSTNSVGDILFGRTNDRECNDEYSRQDNGWYQVGRGRDNNSIYERRTRDRNGNLIIQRARRNSNGRLTIISTRRVNSNDRQWGRNDRDDRRDRRDDKRDDRRDHDDDDDDDKRGRGHGRDD